MVGLGVPGRLLEIRGMKTDGFSPNDLVKSRVAGYEETRDSAARLPKNQLADLIVQRWYSHAMICTHPNRKNFLDILWIFVCVCLCVCVCFFFASKITILFQILGRFQVISFRRLFCT